MSKSVRYSVLVSAVLMVSLLSGPVPASQETAARAAESDEVKTMQIARQTARPTASTTLAAPGQVLRSAACCKKSCGPNTPHCGQDCSIVDSLSQCSGENWHNITFECPSNKGMSCTGSNCSCQ